MRLETASVEEGAPSRITTALVFGGAGLLSGLACMFFGQYLSWPPAFGVSLGQPLVFAGAMAAVIFLTRMGSQLDVEPLNWLMAFVATVGLYFLVVKLLFLGWFSQAFALRGDLVWINFGLCGVIGAVGMGLIVGTITKVAPPVLFAALPAMGVFCALAAIDPFSPWDRPAINPFQFFLFPWWQTGVAAILGLWMVAATGEE